MPATGRRVADALAAYRQLIVDVLQAAREEGADLRFWSAWNEPNHPAFVSPQRATCDTTSPSLGAGPYAELTRTLIQALDEAPGDQQIVLGETAGYLKPGRYATTVPEFIAGLPQDVVCASSVWSQHAYIGGDDPVEAVAQALAARGCPHPFTIWITETGVGAAPSDLSVADAIADEQEGCRQAPRAPRHLVQRPPRDRGLPVHGARGRQVPDRPLQHRPQHAPAHPGRVDRVGRRARSARAATPVRLLKRS